MKVEYIAPFIHATQKVLQTMAFTEASPGRPSLKAEHNIKAMGDVSAVIELTGDGRGSMGMSFARSSILGIAQRMFGEVFSELDHEIVDMVGEIVNMVSGEARRELSKLGYKMAAGLPVTSIGPDHEIHHFVPDRIVMIPFETPDGALYVEACFESKHSSS